MKTQNLIPRHLVASFALAATLVGCASQGLPPPVIPLDEPVTKVSPLWVEGSEGVELPAPSVGVSTKKKKDGTSD